MYDRDELNIFDDFPLHLIINLALDLAFETYLAQEEKRKLVKDCHNKNIDNIFRARDFT